MRNIDILPLVIASLIPGLVERLNLTIRQHVAAVGRRVSTLCKGEDGMRQQLALYHVYYNFCRSIYRCL